MKKQFIIFGQSRSGSTLLVELLNAHSNIHCDGELLNFESGYIKNEKLLNLVRRYPFPYFNYMKRRAQQDAYGFKLLFYQTRCAPYVLKRLRRNGWKFIRVHRRNVVHQAFSKIIAGKTGQWHRRTGDEDPTYRVTVGIEELDFELKRRERWTARELELIRDIDHLDICYEDELFEESAWPSTMNKLARYLRMDPFEVGQPSLRRTDDRAYANVITNYVELKDYLSTTPYREHLSEGGGP